MEKLLVYIFYLTINPKYKYATLNSTAEINPRT